MDMNGRERLMRTLRGEPVDRPALSFYEIGGFDVNPADPDPFNIYNDPSWQPLLKLAEEHTDLIRMRSARFVPRPDNREAEFVTSETHMEGPSRYTRVTIRAGKRTLTALSRRDPDMHTTWHLEHFIKDADDLNAYMELPDDIFSYDVDISNLLADEEAVGDRGIVMVDRPDPLCVAAELFDMQNYLVVAMTERDLFRRLLDKVAPGINDRTEEIARLFPGRLWRVVGPEYACPPYLPPALFREYVVNYTRPAIESIRKYGGIPRLHCHGKLRQALPMIVEMGAMGLDPVEPPPQGDVELAWVRGEFGKDLVLFGNIEIAEIENLPPAEFERRVAGAIADGTRGAGKGFVLMPTACPCGRKVAPRTFANYETMVRLVEGIGRV